MSAIRELVFDWLFNASVQIGLFAILAAVLSPFIAKAKAKYQHCFYLAIFALCLALRLSSTPSGRAVQVWSQRNLSSSRYRGLNTVTITSGLEQSLQRRTSRSVRCLVRKPRFLLSGSCFFFIS